MACSKANADVHYLSAADWLCRPVADLRTSATVSAGRTTISRRGDRRQSMARGRTASVGLL